MTTKVLEKKERLFDSFLLEKGTELVKHLFASIRTAQIYDKNNAIFVKQINSLTNVINDLLKRENHIQLKLKGGHVFLNENRLKFDFQGYTASRSLMDEFPRYMVESVTIEPGVNQMELNEFVCLFLDVDPEKGDAFAALQSRV
ncbi:MAG: hypothetical protein WBD28_07535, partial [Candidatus Zixiibacteriota bacterium]